MRRSLACFLLLLATVPIGLAARYVPLHLPWFWHKYLGSALWAVALYWFIAIFRTHWQPAALFTFTSAAAILVELTRLTPQPQMDAFRLTLAGKLLLGRYFSVKNIAAYLIAIALTAWADRKFHPGRIPASTPLRPRILLSGLCVQAFVSSTNGSNKPLVVSRNAYDQPRQHQQRSRSNAPQA